MNDYIELESCSLHTPTYDDSSFIHELFSDNEVRKYYVLRRDHAKNLNLFVTYIVESKQRGTGLNYIIKDDFGDSIGLISAELVRDTRNGNGIWNIGYAIHPDCRNQGYATEALNGLSTLLLRSFSIAEVMLDISEYNQASAKVAQKCGFKKPVSEGRNNMGCVDMEHMELGFRYKWYKSLAGKRIAYFNHAANAYRNRDYEASLHFFQQALNEDYPEGSPYTDAQIYANMAMAYSSLHRYREDYECLMKAKRMGLNNASIEKELRWLKENVRIG